MHRQNWVTTGTCKCHSSIYSNNRDCQWNTQERVTSLWAIKSPVSLLLLPTGILLHNSNQTHGVKAPKSYEILMFVCLDPKRCLTMLWCHKASSYSLCWSVGTMSILELCVITALFGVFLETNKHQNLMRLSKLVTNKHQNVLCLCISN